MLTLDKSILIISHKLTVEICTLRKNYSGGFGRYFAPLYYDVHADPYPATHDIAGPTTAICIVFILPLLKI